MRSKSAAFFSGMGQGLTKGVKIGLAIALAAGIGFGIMGIVAGGLLGPGAIALNFAGGFASGVFSVGVIATIGCSLVGAVWGGIDEYIDASEVQRSKQVVNEVLKLPVPEKGKGKDKEKTNDVASPDQPDTPPITPNPTPSAGQNITSPTGKPAEHASDNIKPSPTPGSSSSGKWQDRPNIQSHKKPKRPQVPAERSNGNDRQSSTAQPGSMGSWGDAEKTRQQPKNNSLPVQSNSFAR